jgi:hypothetical protein
MGKYFLSIIIVAAMLAGCRKEAGNIYLLRTIPGGCAAERSARSTNTADSVGVSYTVTNGELDLKVGFFWICCGPHSITSKVEAGVITVNFDSNGMDYCNCLCFHTYDFIFSNSGVYRSYIIKIDNYTKFSGELKP